MIITLEEAQKVKPDVREEDIKSLETAIRKITNNRFYREVNGRPAVRHNVSIKDGAIVSRSDFMGIRKGDRIELSGTHYNPELLTVDGIEDKKILVKENEELLDESRAGMFITLIHYPADVKAGVKNILAYQHKMGDKVGLKSISIARVTHTYYDVTANDNVEGIPASLFDFIRKYERISWGV